MHTHTGSMLSSTPAAKYDQRQNRGGVVCTLNDALLPRSWRGTGSKITINHYDPETALKSSYQYMFQKVSEKALSKFISSPPPPTKMKVESTYIHVHWLFLTNLSNSAYH